MPHLPFFQRGPTSPHTDHVVRHFFSPESTQEYRGHVHPRVTSIPSSCHLAASTLTHVKRSAGVDGGGGDEALSANRAKPILAKRRGRRLERIEVLRGTHGLVGVRAANVLSHP